MSFARQAWRHFAFAAAFVAANLVHAAEGTAITHSIVWLPTGVAIAGVWLLSLRALWVVFVAVAVQRLWDGYCWDASLPAALGSSAETALGVLVLRAARCDSAFERLRDVLGVFVAAATAPLASAAVSFAYRTLTGVYPPESGYEGWWRMNALGVVAVVPLALTWTVGTRRRPTARTLAEATLLVATMLFVLWGVMAWLPASTAAIQLLYALVPLVPMLLFAAWRFGQRGATATALLVALVVALASSHGSGPFVLVPLRERHTPIQLFELTLLAVPLLFGSLLAERQANALAWFRSEGQRTALLRVLPDIVYRLRTDGTVLDVLAPPGTLLPTPRERLVGRPLEDLLPADVAARLRAAIELAHVDGRSTAVEFPLSAPHHRRVREARFVRLGDDEVLGIVRDVSERAAMERLLAWQARVLELVATAHPIQAVFREIVAGIERQMGRGRCSILLLHGRRLHLACAPALPADYNAAIEGFEIGATAGTCGAAAHHNRTIVTEDIATDPNWSIAREVAVRNGLRACWSVPIRSRAGTPVGTFAIYHGEPQRPQQAEIDLVERAAVLTGVVVEREQRESLLVSIQRHVGEGLFRCVPGRGLTYANQRFAEMFGYDSPETMLRLVAGDADLPVAHRADVDALGLDPGDAPAGERQLHRRDGTPFWALVSTALVQELDGTAACVGVVADITARKELEEQLQQAQRLEAIGKLAGGVAHDFNNLLTAISGFTESLDESLAPGDPRRADTRGVLEAARRAAGLTQQLLAFGRRQRLASHVVDLAAVVDDLTQLLRRLVGDAVLLRCELPGTTVPVRVDRSQMEQVLLNLVVNARDAMPDGGTVTIRVTGHAADEGCEPHALLGVRDTGTGMDELVRSRAFDPFFTTKQPGKGTGLGLSTVYGIVQQSDGEAWIDSAPGAGTTVWIRLPLSADPAPPTPPTPPADPVTAPATILLAEDEAPVRALMERALTRAGHTVLCASDGLEALAIARAHTRTIDLLVTDVMMPGLGGRELAVRLGAERPGLPVLFVSGFVGDAVELGLDPPGPTRFLEKPFALAALRTAVHDLLRLQSEA